MKKEKCGYCDNMMEVPLVVKEENLTEYTLICSKCSSILEKNILNGDFRGIHEYSKEELSEKTHNS